LEVVTGRVADARPERYRHQKLPAFPQQVAAAYPRRQLHVGDNLAAHQHPAVRAWLVLHRRMRLHLTPTPGSRLNLVEAFFSILTRQALRHGNLPTVADLIAAISRSIHTRNGRCAPFTWTQNPDTVLAKTTHSGTARHKRRQLGSTTDL